MDNGGRHTRRAAGSASVPVCDDVHGSASVKWNELLTGQLFCKALYTCNLLKLVHTQNSDVG